MAFTSGDMVHWKSETVTFVRVVEPVAPAEDMAAMNGSPGPVMARVRKQNDEIILVPLEELSLPE